MIKQPPHLPKKTCSIKFRDNIYTLKVFIFYIVMTLVAGITGALITFSWLMPNYNNSEFYLFNYGENNSIQNESATSILNRRFEYNTVKIFDNNKKIYDDFYSQDAFIGRAILLSSNGWAVFYDPDFTFTKIKNWSIIDYKGLKHKIENTIFDAENNFVYIKLNGEGFHVISFADVNNLELGNKVWYSSPEVLKSVNIFSKEKVLEKSHWSSEDFYLFKIDEVNYNSNIIFDDQGKIYGFLNENFTIKPIWKVEKDISSILEDSSLSKLENDFKGFFVSQEKNDNLENENQELISGFYVKQLQKYVGDDYIKVGDIILEINGSKITKENLSNKIINLEEKHTIKVWRQGEILILDL